MTSPRLTLIMLDPETPGGRRADAAAPALPVTDLGVARGDGVFETLLAVDGRPRKLGAHLDRLAASARVMDLDLPERAEWERAVEHGLRAHAESFGAEPGGRLAVRLVATRGDDAAAETRPTCWVQVAPSTLPTREASEPISVLLLDRGYDSGAAERAPWLLLGAKTLSYAVNMAALRHAKKHGADDVVFVTSDGKLLEGPTSTLLMARVAEDGTKTLITPERRTGILPGTTQAAIFELAKAAGWELGYGPLESGALFESDAAWLASSVRLLARIETADGRPIGADPALAERLTDELWEMAESIT
ncbi:aminodeoxychorismate lyase [Falsarthrobacter nasiphocae]|uniref:4-amino-4-deoxychorismate lyase n=1 Tax=Falsarthrobacter nasiphocae TaxID=189863 RepID=A0AAE4C5F7_9MICC|nr:aminodeoxychorismate lyase [Falsarthrobacter nasiphocae]MDR6892296.1 4-amino-4-deoxychorismate lyase [Falsarthrobacter nasiphocae]